MPKHENNNNISHLNLSKNIEQEMQNVEQEMSKTLGPKDYGLYTQYSPVGVVFELLVEQCIATDELAVVASREFSHSHLFGII